MISSNLPNISWSIWRRSKRRNSIKAVIASNVLLHSLDGVTFSVNDFYWFKLISLSLKSLYISYDGILEPIGKSQVISYLIELSKKRISFVVISFEKPEKLNEKKKVDITKKNLAKKNIKWIPLKYHKRFRISATAYDILAGVITGILVYRKFRFQVIHSRSFVASIIALILKSILKSPFIYDVRGFWSDERIMGGTLNKNFLYRTIKKTEANLLKKADHIIVLTESAKERLKSFRINGTNRVTSIPCCVDNRFKFSNEGRKKVRDDLGLTNSFVVIHAGSLEKWYRADKMLECFSVIKERINNAHFLILSFMNKESLLPLINSAGLPRESVTFTTAKYEEMPSYISAADVGLFFLKTSPAASGFSPVKLGEYVSCRLPIISNTNIGDMDNIFFSYRVGSLVPKYTNKAYQTALDEILSLKENLHSFHQSCDNLIFNELSIKTGVEKYFSVYKYCKDFNT